MQNLVNIAHLKHKEDSWEDLVDIVHNVGTKDVYSLAKRVSTPLWRRQLERIFLEKASSLPFPSERVENRGGPTTFAEVVLIVLCI
jgi:hypothetical protein